MSEGRLLILLDVDGVLNPARSVSESGSTRLVVTPDRGDLVRRLSQLGDIVWCSSWPFSTLSLLGQDLGLGVLDAVPLRQDAGASGKSGSIVRWVSLRRDRDEFPWRRLVWVDDSIRAEDDAALSALDVPALALRIDPASGLTAADIDAAGRFAHESPR